MSRRNRERAAAEAASEAGRVLQAQRQPSETVDPPAEPESTQDEREPGERPALRNEPRRIAMEEIERRDLESKGIEETPEVKPAEAEKPAKAETPDAETPTAAVEPAAEVEIKLVRVKVDGEEFDVPQAEIDEAGGIPAYRQNRAAENRLKKANETLAQVRQTEARIAQFAQQIAPKQPVQTDDQFIASKVDTIRFGTPEESAAALREVMERSNPRVDQSAITAVAVSKMQQAQAVESFQKEFADITGNPLLLKLATTLENEQIAQLQGPPNWPTFYRSLGNQVRSVIGRPSQPAATETATPTADTPSQASDKEARKASIVNLPTAAARAALPEAAKPETREDILNSMRKARGLPTG